MSQYTYDEVADWFLSKGEGKISPKKLQKLVYYAYAWTLTLLNDSAKGLDNRLFDDAHFEAWVHGPVIHELYNEYSKYGFNPIDKIVSQPHFTEDVEDILQQVWDVYGNYTADELESMTHQEEPWKNARKGLSPLESSSNKISDKDIFECYVQRVG
ncbi:DUF4065 domain-containing protein [Limosilactobacillus vaginalis]|uniref:DUF4065 domain-containing protein n=1 Tax=Limosilactobacillus vaginalis TaxID=1633 RepID=A0ABT4K7V7_9LACO|nr:type II toxin-antitoxin system antitoxin SocA domain-containing protein [Limosilactobacillus vaginalis]MCZ3747079.1 DUF4065 domain-containing protein [Limosilactobacillus vaginalis]MCZ3752061.1 DUF4065 domain-containing protein [Limosilactobacillus vaginalis]MCZ3753733.1 DUF4065 domain-containing protein [Limosilactobacillus vaginalis]MCZ3755487.1 DUF4065 domain-containing protein [Limosilactobacillus vaginalis]MCZ3757169.1 DUF4065 domain-containing protein [Limosilactobacillus vaginalis]